MGVFLAALAFLKDLATLFVKMVLAITGDVLGFFIPANRKNLRDAVVLITGGGGALGREIAVQLSMLGARIVLCDIDEEALRRAGVAVQRFGGEFHLYKCDVTNPTSIEDMAARMSLEVGQVNILIHCAGVYYHKPLLEHTEQMISNTLAVNTLATITVTQKFLGPMISSNSGHVILVSSLLGSVGQPMVAPYCASKSAVNGFSDALRQELKSLGVDGVSVTTVQPYMLSNITDVVCIPRFPALFQVLTPREAAKSVIDGFRDNVEEIYLPRQLKPLMAIHQCLPRSVRNLCQEFMETKAAGTSSSNQGPDSHRSTAYSSS